MGHSDLFTHPHYSDRQPSYSDRQTSYPIPNSRYGGIVICKGQGLRVLFFLLHLIHHNHHPRILHLCTLRNMVITKGATRVTRGATLHLSIMGTLSRLRMAILLLYTVHRHTSHRDISSH